MTDAIMRDEKRVLPCTAYLEGEYGVDNLFMGVPTRLGASGVEAIIELELDTLERAALAASAAAVREVVVAVMFALRSHRTSTALTTINRHRDDSHRGSWRNHALFTPCRFLCAR